MNLIAREQARGHRFALVDDDGYSIAYAHTEEEAERHALALGERGSTLRFEYLDGRDKEIDL